MKNETFLIGTCLAVVLCVTPAGFAADKKSAAASPEASASPAAKTPRSVPFHGMVAAVDQKANTFTITGKEKSRVFKITDKTAVTKGANTATIKDIAENQEVSGSYWKNADGSLEAKTVKVGPMGSAAKSAEKKASSSPAASASPKKP